MKATNEWVTYRTRFLVKAKQLTSSLTFTDALGRQHSGRRGDYLVESSDCVVRIAPRQIFEDIYVPIAQSEGEQAETSSSDQTWEAAATRCAAAQPPHVLRKSPQSDRSRRGPIQQSL
jgi:hypothetical protein